MKITALYNQFLFHFEYYYDAVQTWCR